MKFFKQSDNVTASVRSLTSGWHGFWLTDFGQQVGFNAEQDADFGQRIRVKRLHQHHLWTDHLSYLSRYLAAGAVIGHHFLYTKREEAFAVPPRIFSFQTRGFTTATMLLLLYFRFWSATPCHPSSSLPTIANVGCPCASVCPSVGQNLPLSPFLARNGQKSWPESSSRMV